MFFLSCLSQSCFPSNVVLAKYSFNASCRIIIINDNQENSSAMGKIPRLK